VVKIIHPRQNGLSTLELVLAIALFTLLAGVAAYRFRYLQEAAEKTAVEMTVMNIRTGLRNKTAELMMENRMPELPALLQENPVNWLEKPPENYVGERSDQDQIPPGSWYFDRKQQQLVYRLNLDGHFEGGGEGPAEIRYRAVGLMQSLKRGATEVSTVVGIKLEAVSAVRWF